MSLRYLTANAAWVFVFGDGDIIPMGDHPRFFESRDAAVRAARVQGLLVTRTGGVYSN